MKKVFNLAAAVMAAFLFASCASIPEPSEKNQTMLYAVGDLQGTYPSETRKAQVSTEHKKGNIYLRVKNVTKNKIYTLKSNKNGEFIKTNLPEGYYKIQKVSATYYRGQSTNSCWWQFSDTEPDARFKIEKGVTNLGYILLKVNYISGRVDIQWRFSYDNAKDVFLDNHPESEWTDAVWTTMDGDEQE